MRALIVADSPEFDAELIARLAPAADRIIVTDGAVHRLPAGVVPHIVCGDFDSIDLDAAKRRFPFIDYLHDGDQYSNDLEKAVLIACQQGATDIVMACALGGKPDLNYAALCVAMTTSLKASVELRYAGMRCIPLAAEGDKERALRIALRNASRLSVLPEGGGATVSLEGVHYPLARQELRYGAEGVSNMSLEGEVVVRIHRGRAFFFCEERDCLPIGSSSL
jgi:thiamine pyrophosphokinase